MLCAGGCDTQGGDRSRTRGRRKMKMKMKMNHLAIGAGYAE